MSLMALVYGVTIFIAGVVLTREYDWWASRVAVRIVHLAALLTPREQRDRWRAEWLGELDAVRADGTAGILFALNTTVAGIRLRAVDVAPTLARLALQAARFLNRRLNPVYLFRSGAVIEGLSMSTMLVTASTFYTLQLIGPWWSSSRAVLLTTSLMLLMGTGLGLVSSVRKAIPELRRRRGPDGDERAG